MIAKDSWSTQTKDPSRSWQARWFGTDFDDLEGFSTVRDTKSFMIMAGRGRCEGAGAHGAGYGPNGRVCALTTSHAHHRMTTVREGASLEASTASPAAGAAGAIVAALARAGTRLVFGVPGGGPNLDVVGAAEAAGLRFVLARGETAATIMAATYADLTGAPGAVVVTRGPGLASAGNGIAPAALARLPLVVIADTVPSATPRITHQLIDQDALGRSVAKTAITVGGPRAAGRAVRTALAAPRGPVVANMDESAPDPETPESPVAPTASGTRAMTEAGTLVLTAAMSTARRPLVLL